MNLALEQELEEGRVAPPPALTAQPLVKWVGGKGAMVDRIIRAMPETFGTYYEPFAGGAAVAFELVSRGLPRRVVLGDANIDLIRAYREVARNPEAVIRRLRWMARLHGPDFYARTRAQWNADNAARYFGGGWTDVQRAAAFLYLNRTCFNGLWRVNRSGEFNVPMGDYRNPSICDPDRVRAAAAALQRMTLHAQDFRRTAADAGRGDVVFFDPPYVPRDATSNFTAYHSDGFGDREQRDLAAFALELVGRGVHVILTNNDVPRVRELYGSRRWKRSRVMMTRAVSCRADRRAAVGELLITGRLS